MHLSAQRVLLTALVVTATAFVTAGVLGNDQTGLRGTAGDVAWIAFLIALLVTAVLAVAVLTQGALRRRRASR